VTVWVGVAALVLALVLGALAVPMLRRAGIGQQVRSAGPATHLKKQGTPTMGGVIFLVPAAVVTLAAFWRSPTAWALVVFTLGFAALGFMDDYMKVVHRRPLGLRAREKLVVQLAWSAAFLWVGARYLGAAQPWRLPWGGAFNPGGWYYPLGLLALVGTVNGVNETDGADGLAGGTAVVALGFFALFAANRGRPVSASYALALAAAVVGFLRYNLHPARVIMGDTGSLALGAALGGLAVLTQAPLLLPVVGGVFVVETLSVIIQVASFRLTRRRVFRMSPLHHHFEVSGWPEERVVGTFWLAALAFALLAWV
jgi:phospho-N-acetylmuramoyl-pentapeptide-transferase